MGVIKVYRLGGIMDFISTSAQRVAFLSSHTAVVSGCEIPNLHRNGNYHTFFVSSSCLFKGCFF
jgi:hypothetical protein